MRFFFDPWDKTFTVNKDGRRVYFPRGPLGPAYIIPSEDEFHRFKKKVKILTVIFYISIVALIPVMHYQPDIRGVILVIYCIVPYQLWCSSQCRHLERADAGYTFNERIAKQAREIPTNFLRLNEILSVAFFVAGIFIIMMDWRHWLYSLASIVLIIFSGFRAWIAAKMLMAKRQSRNGNS